MKTGKVRRGGDPASTRTPHAAGLLQMVQEIGTLCIVRKQYMSLRCASRSAPCCCADPSDVDVVKDGCEAAAGS
jgi:hypothetical protein